MCVNISPYEYSNKGDYETGRFIGLYASEGGSTKSSINLSFHIDEEEYANFIKNYASKHFCNHITEVLHPEEHCRRITIYGNEVSAFVKSFVSGNVWTKSLQSKCFDTSLEFRKGLIDGYFEGDGEVGSTK